MSEIGNTAGNGTTYKGVRASMGNDFQEVLTSVLDEGNDIIYLSGLENYKLYYLNKKAINALGNIAKEEWFEKPCYQVLQGNESPCDFCPRNMFAEGSYVWKYFNKKMGKHLFSKDLLVERDGKRFHLGISSDITEEVELENRLKAELSAEKALVKCAGILNQYNKQEKFDGIAEEFLYVVAGYYRAESAYTLWFDLDKEIVSDAFRWRMPTERPMVNLLEDISFEKVRDFLHRLSMKKDKVLISLKEVVPEDSEEYKVFRESGILKFMIVPVKSEGKIIGLLGVSNPRENLDTTVFLKSAAVFFTNEMRHRTLADRVIYLSNVDELTEVGNRRSYLDRLAQMGRHEFCRFGVLVADIDRLRTINNAYGRQWGDFMLIHTAEVLKSFFGDDVYRIGEDEFMAFGRNMDKSAFEHIAKELTERTKWDDQFQVSVGSSYYDGENDIEYHISVANEKMSLAKMNHYSEGLEAGKQIETRSKYQAVLSEKLREEISNNQFRVYLQPQINLKTGKIGGAEALVRYIDEEGSIVPPIAFIDKYESEGLIRYIDMYMLESVCRLIKKWKSSGIESMNISVNFSRVTLTEEDIVKKMRMICDQYRVPPHLITIEITENMGLLERHELRELLGELQRMGFSISLDDFGSRYSDLAILSIADFDEIKLDKSMVDKIESKGKSRTITEYILYMCRDLKLTHTVAEGIETVPQREILKRYGCELGQGYLFDRPMPVEDFEKKYITC